jgi:hypothetical protein
MLGPAGTARLALENDEVRTKMVIEAEGVTKLVKTGKVHNRVPHHRIETSLSGQ